MNAHELLAAATPRPWRYAAPGSHPLHPGAVVLADGMAEGSLFVADCAWDATSYRDAELIVAAVNEYEALHAVADDALALLDQHISEEQRRELGIRIIDRLTEIGKLRDAREVCE